jgi:hypothetical protein
MQLATHTNPDAHVIAVAACVHIVSATWPQQLPILPVMMLRVHVVSTLGVVEVTGTLGIRRL